MSICNPTQTAYQHLLREVQAFLTEIGQEHDDALYCLVLQYVAVKNPLPPALWLGWESERHIATQNPDDFSIWIPMLHSERQYEIEFDDEATAAFEAMLRSLGDFDTEDVVGKMLTRAAKEITRMDWTGIANVTPEFVCFALDYEFEVPVENAVRRCATREKIARLEQRGML
jgi:hypothetical protein